MYTGETPLPIGLVFGFATVFFASLWAALALRRGGATIITGAFAFLVIYALAFMRPRFAFCAGKPGLPADWFIRHAVLLGTPVISLLAFFVFIRTKEGNAFYNTRGRFICAIAGLKRKHAELKRLIILRALHHKLC